jgi:hypothetical protein
VPDCSAHTSTGSNGGNNRCIIHAISQSSIASENHLRNTRPCCGPTGADQQKFQHTIILVSPADAEQTTDNTTIVTQSDPKTGIDHEESSRKRQYAKIIRAQTLRPKCTSLPSLEPYRDRLQLHLRRAACLPISKRCSSSVPSRSNTIRRATRELPLSHSKCEDATVVSNLSPSSSTSSVAQEKNTITTRSPSSS